MQKEKNKLIRDKIPGMINKRGQKAKFKTLNEKEFKEALLKKLKEETNEVIEAQDNKEELKNEIGDVYEVIDTIIKVFNLDRKEILKKQKEKRKERGAFEKRVFLKSVEE